MQRDGSIGSGGLVSDLCMHQWWIMYRSMVTNISQCTVLVQSYVQVWVGLCVGGATTIRPLWAPSESPMGDGRPPPGDDRPEEDIPLGDGSPLGDGNPLGDHTAKRSHVTKLYMEQNHYARQNLVSILCLFMLPPTSIIFRAAAKSID